MQNPETQEIRLENTAVEKYFVTRRLPSLATISHSTEDEHVRTKLSNMSFKDHHPLLKRVIDPSEQYQQRRHSIASVIEPEYLNNGVIHTPSSAPSTPPHYQYQSSSCYFLPEDAARRNSLMARQDSGHRITELILNEEENNGRRRASTSSISSSSSSLHDTNLKGRYARSPELRTSHKLAERRRRQEMKDLFDELQKTLPVDKSLKTSRWEVLNKSIDYIGTLHRRIYAKENELAQLKEEVQQLKRKHYIA
ncbi:hypothetical protein G6F62_001326 [Rhizopus arrhizus]|nr:hypothetical protein G6F23_000119 [Rhizopus arrhizus]KAG0769608.1 hypothetical protein G6F24_000920 [Rhizopus arrhizus]KAG0787623.1 hypothetical protein G6F22_007255 [Rhizopus arrhizus]KAG0796488.1 hypothetical protein G6F21_001263 [Rhizopus arrhizus]KAG0819040.1 hypothetical protein G6F20_001060 [Rhizopus arrhizus]